MVLSCESEAWHRGRVLKRGGSERGGSEGWWVFKGVRGAFKGVRGLQVLTVISSILGSRGRHT